MMDRTQAVVTIAMLLAAIVVVVLLAVLAQQRRRPAPLPADPAADPAVTDESVDAVMRALALVQHRYAALARQYDAGQARIRELEDDNARLRRGRNSP